jgi:poly-gamma-glutamate capsule biosynthesis protein CapA/YwtB (metallophosphatase superfamily)
VNEEQRRWARWLVARGANVIVGSHPHLVQREESHGGAMILHSLGNAVYPTALRGADSGEIRSFILSGCGAVRQVP